MKLTAIRHHPHLFKNEKGVIYFRMFRAPYGEFKKSTRTTSVLKAERVAQKFKEKFFNEKNEKRNVKNLVEDEWAEFLELQKNKAPATYASIETQGRVHLMPFFGDKFPEDVNETLWERYIAHANQKTPGRKLFNDRKYLSMLLNHLFRVGVINRLPKLRDPDPELKAGKVFSDEEIERLLDNAGPDLELQILMALTMGMRLSEIIFLSWERVDLVNKTIHLRAQDTKIRKARTFAISDAVYSRLSGRYRVDGPPYVFPSPVDENRPVGRQGNKSAWSACRRRAQVKGRFHDLRHTFLTKAFKNSINPALICHYAGLSLEEAERTYLHFTVEDTRTVSSLVRART